MELEKGLVSVIMSNFNTPEEYLRKAIESVLNQTYENIEFIIIDDCSTDKSLDIIKSYTDPRVRLFINLTNMGITKSLNKALNVARGEFVARMDADDICMATRFEKQVAYLKEHSDIVVCGTGVELIGEGAYKHKEKFVLKEIPEREEFQIRLLFGNHTNIIHPTAMFRRSMLLKYNLEYNENYVFAQDYRMWVECSQVGSCANVPEILFQYRIHDKAVSSDKKSVQNDCAKRIMEEQLSWINLTLPEEWEEVHYGLLTGRKNYDLKYKSWIQKIIGSNKSKGVFEQKMLEMILWNKWAEITYYELYKGSILHKIRVLINTPVKCYKELLAIKMRRRTKSAIL